MKNYKLLIILFILIAVAGIYYFSNTKGTLNLRNSDFAIESPNGITKIQISTLNESLTLEKEMDTWKVNNKYRATQKYVVNLLLVMNRIDVLSPVLKTEKGQIASILKADGVLVKVFKNHRTLKSYYVSKPEMNKEKTYMMMEKSSSPFVVRIPAFKGLLANFFVIDESYWRDKTIFDYEPQNMKNIRVEYPENPISSFQVINYNNGTFAIQNLDNNQFIENFNVNKVARYFTYYQRIVFEDIAQNIAPAEMDSILQTTPFCVISVDDITGSTNKITIYRKPPENKFDEFGKKINFDFNKAYATLNNNQELIIIQYYIFDPLFKEIDYFR